MSRATTIEVIGLTLHTGNVESRQKFYFEDRPLLASSPLVLPAVLFQTHPQPHHSHGNSRIASNPY